MAIPKFNTIGTNDAPYYSRHDVTYKKVYSRDNRDMRLSVWFDGMSYFPLVEKIDIAGVPIKGKLLRENVRLVKALAWAEEWVKENC
jgi:hypothetical protein